MKTKSVQMENMQQINIDKYLDWYKRLSNDLSEYPAKKKKFDKLAAEKAGENNIVLEAFQLGLSGNGGERLKQWEERNKEYDYLFDEIHRLMIYVSDEYYIPTTKEWEYLDFGRASTLKENKSDFKAHVERSVLSEKALAEQELKLIYSTLFSIYNYFENIKAGTPLLKSVLKVNSTIGGKAVKGAEWGVFCQWVYNMDFAQWLNGKANGIEETTVSTKNEVEKTAAGVALYYYYLSEFGGEDGLYSTNTLNHALETFQIKSKKNLQNQRDYLSKNSRDITLISKESSRIEKDEKLKRLRFAYTCLKEKTNNQKAIARALQDLRQVEEKINGNPKALI